MALCLGAGLAPALGPEPEPRPVLPRALLEGHKGGWPSLSFSPDGKLLAVSSYGPGEAVKVWDVRKAKEVATLKGFLGGTVLGVAFSPDGRLLATTGARQPARLYDTATWKVRRRLKGATGSIAVAFSPDSKVLATLMQGDGLLCWSSATGEGLPGPVSGVLGANHVAFSPDGKALAVAGWKEAALWRWPGGELRAVLKEHTGRVTCLAFSPDGKTLATGELGVAGREHHILLWDVATGKRKGGLDLGRRYGVLYGCAFSPDSKSLAVVGTGEYVWDVETRWPYAKLQRRSSGVSMRVAYSPDGRTLALGLDSGVVQLFDAPKRK
jgi:WD40 repeat protein